jgi:hypothetical protein
MLYHTTSAQTLKLASLGWRSAACRAGDRFDPKNLGGGAV